MSFERIKTIKGHQYKYEVESIRENGKVKQRIVKYFGRVDKNPKNGVTIPYGFYYFSQEGCSGCYSKQGFEAFFDHIKQISGEELPQLYYIDISKDENPINLRVIGTPTVCEIGVQGLYINVGFNESDWVLWHFGDKKGREIAKVLESEYNRQRKESFKEKIRQGWNNEQLLHHFGSIKTKEVEKWRKEVQREKAKNCKDGVCQLPA